MTRGDRDARLWKACVCQALRCRLVPGYRLRAARLGPADLGDQRLATGGLCGLPAQVGGGRAAISVVDSEPTQGCQGVAAA